MRVLVVEGEMETAVILKAQLEAECYSVDIENNGEKGSYRARTIDYDLILLDGALTEGGERVKICKELRRHRVTVPILILSSRDEVEEKVAFLNSGADDYLTKPYSFTELSARMKALLRRPKEVITIRLQMGDLILDRSQFTVCRGGKRIYLTAKEFSLLEYFLKNKGSVVSRAMIIEHVWDGDTDPFSNTVEAHIHNLRHKLHLPGRKKLIHTLPGRGYKIADCL